MSNIRAFTRDHEDCSLEPIGSESHFFDDYADYHPKNYLADERPLGVFQGLVSAAKIMIAVPILLAVLWGLISWALEAVK